MHILASTESCCPGLFSEETELLADLRSLIHYDLPLKREMLNKRLKGFLGVNVRNKQQNSPNVEQNSSNACGTQSSPASASSSRLADGKQITKKIKTSLYFVGCTEAHVFQNVESLLGEQIAELISLDDVI